MRGRGALNPHFGAPRDANKDLPGVLSEAADTGRVSLASRGLTAFPPELLSVSAPGAKREWWLVAAVRAIDLSFNPLLRALPPGIAQLAEGLHTLKLRQCGLAALPEELAVCICLRVLDVAHNALAALPAGLATLPELTELDASDNRLEALPAGWGAGAPRLAVLRLDRNALRRLPEDLGGAGSALRELSAGSNALEGALPAALARCPALAVLCVPGNRLAALLPHGAGPLPHTLATLDARDNRLTALPPLAAPSRALATLLLGGNPLALASDAAAAPLARAAGALCTLDLSRTSLGALPEALRACAASLVSLDLSNNDLNALPPWLGWAHRLNALALEGNPMRALGKRALLAPGVPAAAVLAFLRTRASAEEAALYEEFGAAVPQVVVAAGGAAGGWGGGGGGGGGVGGGGGGGGGGEQPQQWQAPPLQHQQHQQQWQAPPLHQQQQQHQQQWQAPPLQQQHQQQQQLQQQQQHAPPGMPPSAEGAYAPWLDALRDALVTGKLSAPATVAAAAAAAAAAASAAAPAPAPAARRAAPAPPPLTLPLLRGQLLRSTPELTLRLRTLALDGCPGALSAGLPLGLLAACGALEEVSLARCGLRALPEALLQPPHPSGALRALRLAHNALALEEVGGGGGGGGGAGGALPPCLRSLDLRHNALRTLRGLAGLRALTELQVAYNPQLGGSAGEWGGALPPGLCALDLRACGLRALPEGVLALRQLATLDISDNELGEVPPLLGCMEALGDLRAGGNPQRALRQAVLDRGTAAVKEFLRSRVPSGVALPQQQQQQQQVELLPAPVAQQQVQLRAQAQAAQKGGAARDADTGLTWDECVARRGELEALLDEAHQRGTSGGAGILLKLRRDLAGVRAAQGRLSGEAR